MNNQAFVTAEGGCQLPVLDPQDHHNARPDARCLDKLFRLPDHSIIQRCRRHEA